MHLGVADGHVDIDVLVGDLQRLLERSASPLEQLLGLCGAGGGEQDLDLGAAYAAQADLGNMIAQPAAQDVENLACEFGSQLPAQLAEASEPDDGDKDLQLAGLGIGCGNAVDQRAAGGVAGDQGGGEAIGDGVEGGGAAVLGPPSDRQPHAQVAGREPLQGMAKRGGARADARLGRAGTYATHPGWPPYGSRARDHAAKLR